MENTKALKSYSDTYLYSKYPLYTKKITAAIMQDPMIDKKTDAFQDVIYEIKRARVSEGLVRILTSKNVILLDCDEPMPRAFKVFCAKDMRAADKSLKVFIDCTGVITKSKTSSDLIVDESKLLSHLINAGFTFIYHRAYKMIRSKSNLIFEATQCYAKCYTHIIDYLVKVSIQETSKAKVLYLTSMFFLMGVLDYDYDEATKIASKVAEISDREVTMLNILMDKEAHIKGVSQEDSNPYQDIKSFNKVMSKVMKFSSGITNDIIVERWMQQYGPGTVFGMEYFPAFSAMMTDAYTGGYLNNQRTIENVCKVNMVSYTKQVLSLIDNTV